MFNVSPMRRVKISILYSLVSPFLRMSLLNTNSPLISLIPESYVSHNICPAKLRILWSNSTILRKTAGFPLPYALPICTFHASTPRQKCPKTALARRLLEFPLVLPRGGPVETERIMQCAHSKLKVFFVHHHRDLDLRRRNHLDVDPFVGERLEHGAGDAGVGAHADPDHGDFDDLVVPAHLARLQCLRDLAQDIERFRVIRAVHREREVG